MQFERFDAAPRRPTSQGALIPTLVALLLSALSNIAILHAAIAYDHEAATPPPPPPFSPPAPVSYTHLPLPTELLV